MMVLQNLEKKTRHFIEELTAKKGPPIYRLSIAEARKVLDDLQGAPTKKLPVHTEDLTIPVGSHVSIRIVRPPEHKERLPVIMYFHGGGWILGNKGTHDRLVRELACGTNAAVVFVNYTPSPEAKYPKSIEEAFAATQYIYEKGREMNLDSSRMAVVGDSVGGNMAAVVALLAKERGVKIQTQALFYPVTDCRMNTASYLEFAEGPWLTKAAMEWFWDAYLPNKTERNKPHASPLQASIEQLRNLPSALIITDENDVLRDEGEAYAHKLIQAGVEVTAIRYLGTIHDFMMLNPLRDTPATRSAIALACSHLQKTFASELKQKKEKTG